MNIDLKIKEEYLEKAVRLHHENPVVDAHLDLAGEILLRHKAGEKDVLKNHYAAHFKTAGVSLVLSSIFIDNDTLKKEGFHNAENQIQAIKEDIKSVSDKMMFVKNRKDLQKALSEQKTGIILYMEGLDCIGKELSLLKTLYEMGVRGASLTWSRKNDLANGCCRARERIQIKGGLTGYGKEAVKEMERLNMFLDISHLNDDGFEDITHIASRPFIATHSGSKAVYENYRNLTDVQMRSLFEQGGIMGINGCSHIAGSQAGNHLEMLCRHIEYAVLCGGQNHTGYGFDLCDSYDEAESLLLRGKTAGACGNKLARSYIQLRTGHPEGSSMNFEREDRNDCLLNHGQVPLLTAALLQRGMSEETAIHITGGNFLKYFMEVLPV